MAVNDFNGDSVPDLAVANLYSSDVSILLGNGDGTLQTALSVAVGIYPQWVTAGDFNRDGIRDLAVVTQGDDYYFWGHVSVLPGNGDGTFQSAVTLAAGVGAVSVSVADVDDNAALDLLVAANAGVLLLQGNGDGTFRLAGSSPTGGRPYSVATGDFDGDGRQDVASANGNSKTLSVLLGNGDGTFLEAAAYATDRYPESVAVGDFDGDGKADLAVATESNSVSILLGNGDATFQPATTFTAGHLFVFVALGDFNRDGVLDLAMADWAVRSVAVLLGNGDGTFGASASYPVGTQPWSVAIGDFNTDAVQDLAVANHGADPGSNGSVSVLLGRPDGTFSAASTLATGRNSVSVAVGDFNGDLNADLATANIGSGNISVLLGNGNGTFRAAVNYAAAGSRSVVVGDFNADGVPDLAAAGSRASVLLGNGDGTFQAARTFPIGHLSWSVVAGDFNGDGHSDLAAANFDSNSVSVLAGNGDGTFQEPLTFGAGNGPRSAAAGDFNHDGKLDLAVPNVYSNNVSILINRTRDVEFDLSVTTEGNGSGTVTSTSAPVTASQINCGTTCAATYQNSSQVTLTAYANIGSTFAGWTGCDTVSDTTCTVTMSEAKSVAATFTLQRFVLTVTREGIGRGTATSSSDPASSTQINCGTTCSASYDWDTVVTLTATPGFANRFFGWRGCDAASGTTCTVTIRAASAVTATFHGLPSTYRHRHGSDFRDSNDSCLNFRNPPSMTPFDDQGMFRPAAGGDGLRRLAIRSAGVTVASQSAGFLIQLSRDGRARAAPRPRGFRPVDDGQHVQPAADERRAERVHGSGPPARRDRSRSLQQRVLDQRGPRARCSRSPSR